MSAVQQQYSVFDSFNKTLYRDGASPAIRQLVSKLAGLRATLSTEAWHDWCEAAAATHRTLNLLMEDPYTRDARLKPAGYAGDARTLDYVYLRAAGDQPLTDLGRTLFDETTGVPIADAVRCRSLHVTELLTERLQETGTLSAASIACGHARELDSLPSPLPDRLSFWGLDQDEESLKACRNRFKAANFVFENGSIADVLRGISKIPQSDIVYASGLFDYLDDRVGGALVRRMCSALNPGGTMIIANLSPVNEEIAYMEAVMDWWMYYRDEAGFRALAEKARVDSSKNRISTYTTSENRIVWLQVQRLK